MRGLTSNPPIPQVCKDGKWVTMAPGGIDTTIEELRKRVEELEAENRLFARSNIALWNALARAEKEIETLKRKKKP